MLYIASDHAGFELKEKLKIFLKELGYEVKDFGAFEYDEKDDYPDFVLPLVRALAEAEPTPGVGSARGIVIGGSGQGEAMAANRIKGVRAAVYYGSPNLGARHLSALRCLAPKLKIVRLSREHNDANVLSLGARFLSEEEAKEAVRLWLETPFSGEERHKRRIAKLDNL